MKTARLMTVASLLAAAAAFAQPEVEPNNSIATAGAPTGVPATRTGVIANFNDPDYYAITVPAGTSLKIRATPTTHTCITSDLVVSLISAAGGTVASNDDAPEMFYCPEIHPLRETGAANLAGGTYYVAVTNINGASNVGYTLTIETFDMPQPLAPVFTFQGSLREGGSEVNGPRDFTVTLWNHPTGTNVDSRIGSSLHFGSVTVNDGKFVLPLNYGTDVFAGQERYIEIQVAAAGQGPGGTIVGPRQRLTTTPHAIYAMKANHSTTADSASTANYSNSAHSAFNAENAEWADYANSAGSANTAAHASQTPWNGITNMPSGFADGTDNAGPWSVLGSTVYYNTGAVAIGQNSASGFSLAVNGTAAKSGGGSWSSFCDSRLKHDIKPLAGTLDKLLNLRGYTFQYNDAAVEQRLALPGTQIGLMAEEVERVFPDWVERDAGGFRYVTERATTALMVEALRDLRAEKDAALAEKQAQIDALTARLDRLEKAAQK